MPDPRLACGIQPRQSALQGTGRVAECVPLGYACSRDPSAGDARARVDAVVFQPSLGIVIRLRIKMLSLK
jgi:hypothetical protein